MDALFHSVTRPPRSAGLMGRMVRLDDIPMTRAFYKGLHSVGTTDRQRVLAVIRKRIFLDGVRPHSAP